VDNLTKELAAIHARWAPADERVAEILENILRDCADRLPGEGYNRANERHVERFVTLLRKFPGRAYEVVRGESVDPKSMPSAGPARASAATPLRRRRAAAAGALGAPHHAMELHLHGAGREPGNVPAGGALRHLARPGADDNTTGEEILKQYLLADLRAATRPRLTHVYFWRDRKSAA
jgi:hypothetical protein